MRKGSSLDVALFENASRSTRARIEEEAASLGEFLQAPAEVEYVRRS
jgi:hypothetical protein